jgi:hypothetical protein
LASERKTSDFRRGLEAAAKIADMYAKENWRLTSDTILTDPVLRGDMSAEAMEVSKRLQTDGCIHSSMAHAAQNIARAIRNLK